MGIEVMVERHIGAEVRPRSPDVAIAELAERQHGVVSRAQLERLGARRGAVRRRLEAGRLHPVHRGVYAVGHRLLAREGRWMAAVLSGGSGAVLSHRSAAVLWGLRRTGGERIDVSVPRRIQSRPTVRIHHVALPADETTVARGIPVTTPPRTLLDLAGVVGPAQLERAINEAELLRLSDSLSLADVVRRHPGHRGVLAVRRLLAAGRRGLGVSRSELEDLFHDFLATLHVPRPELNPRLHVAGHWIEPDALWRAQCVVAELDGFETHASRAAFERDRARDRALQAAGWRVVRITWRHLRDTPDTLACELTALLA